ncbi:DUF1569 domain-containing protein [Ideonella sp. DXS29W]|uniref:DUF1569 domain-containing protein n=1 Tax=Ideonella lacteola TaxID=2984193 RepID=A0ABU9BQQ7_9BURK
MTTRRRLITAGGVVAGATALGIGVFIATGQRRFETLDDARRAVVPLAEKPLQTTGAWNLAQVLNHAAQSIEYSLDGFPQPKPALFQATVGHLAFALFDARGAMHHPLDQPIPGAPALAADASVPDAVQRLLAAFDRFERHSGALQAHFAYGALDKPAYARAHLMHLANHWAEFSPG